MKITVINVLVILILMSSYSYIKKENNDLSEFNLKGKVKSIREYTYENIDNVGDIQNNKPNGKFVLCYNIKGNLTKRDSYHSDGRLVVNHIYKYDNDGFLIERIVFTLGEMDFGYTFKYDDKGNEIESTSYNSDGNLDYTIIFKYDINGNLVEKIRYNSNGKFEEKSKYTYDDKDIKMDGIWIMYNSDGGIELKTVYKYDDRGNEIEINLYQTDGSITEKHKQNFDDNGNIIESISFYPNGNIYSKDTYEFDNNGNQIEMNSYNSNSENVKNDTTEYEYDENENWIKKIDYENKIVSTIYIREIEYY